MQRSPATDAAHWTPWWWCGTAARARFTENRLCSQTNSALESNAEPPPQANTALAVEAEAPLNLRPRTPRRKPESENDSSGSGSEPESYCWPSAAPVHRDALRRDHDLLGQDPATWLLPTVRTMASLSVACAVPNTHPPSAVRSMPVTRRSRPSGVRSEKPAAKMVPTRVVADVGGRVELEPAGAGVVGHDVGGVLVGQDPPVSSESWTEDTSTVMTGPVPTPTAPRSRLEHTEPLVTEPVQRRGGCVARVGVELLVVATVCHFPSRCSCRSTCCHGAAGLDAAREGDWSRRLPRTPRLQRR